MNLLTLAVRLQTPFALGELKHKGALSTQRLDELKSAARESGVAETFAHLEAVELTLWRPPR